MKMIQQPGQSDRANTEGHCDVCGHIILRFRGESHDLVCPTPDCPAIYNITGQRLRNDLHSRPNPSQYDDDIDDLTGDELSYGADDFDPRFDQSPVQEEHYLRFGSHRL